MTKPVGAQLSYSIVGVLQKMGYEVAERNGVATNLKLVKAGRLSAYAEIQDIADHELANNLEIFSGIEKLDPPLQSKAYYLLVSKKQAAGNPDLRERIFDAILDVKKTPEYAALQKKYVE